MLVLHLSYFIDVVSLVHAYQAKEITWDLQDSFVKQTYRNRCYIAAANGMLPLQIPIIHSKSGQSDPYNQVLIDHSQPWASNHLKSIKSAYKSSPFFDYYVDDFEALFKNIPEKLQEWNLLTAQYLFRKLQMNKSFLTTSDYTADPTATNLITAKGKPLLELTPYMQVFQEKYGFLQPLSGLDLLFNEGPSAGVYLKSQGSLL